MSEEFNYILDLMWPTLKHSPAAVDSQLKEQASIGTFQEDYLTICAFPKKERKEKIKKELLSEKHSVTFQN